MEREERQIAVFDSGMGGISVLREMVKLMPYENFFYYGDSKNAPYGTRTVDEVRDLTIGHVRDFLKKDCKAVAIACNTATSAAVRILRETYKDLPIVGIEPAIKPAVLENRGKNILCMATPMTIREEKFNNLLKKYKDSANIIPLPCPGLMEFVESGHFDTKECKDFIYQLLFDYIDKADAVVLGCTHYPFVKETIRDVLLGVSVYDGALGTAKELKRRIEEAGLLNKKEEKMGSVEFENSDPSEEKKALFKKLFSAD